MITKETIFQDEKRLLESRCQTLQEKVDSFLNEMANSEHADVLLCHVEHLEKDRTSLQTVLEMKTFEVNQLRTKLNEQTVQVTSFFAGPFPLELLRLRCPVGR